MASSLDLSFQQSQLVGIIRCRPFPMSPAPRRWNRRSSSLCITSRSRIDMLACSTNSSSHLDLDSSACCI